MNEIPIGSDYFTNETQAKTSSAYPMVLIVLSLLVEKLFKYFCLEFKLMQGSIIMKVFIGKCFSGLAGALFLSRGGRRV